MGSEEVCLEVKRYGRGGERQRGKSESHRQWAMKKPASRESLTLITLLTIASELPGLNKGSLSGNWFPTRVGEGLEDVLRCVAVAVCCAANRRFGQTISKQKCAAKL